MKIWSSKYADGVASKLVLKLNPICVCCGFRPSTDCSHFYERHHSATRYNFKNLDSLCRICHGLWEGRKNGYEEYKREQLGAQGYIDLQRLAYSVMKRDIAVANFMRYMENQP